MSQTFNLEQLFAALSRQGFTGYSIDHIGPDFLLTLQRQDGSEEQRRMSTGELAAWFNGLLSHGPPLEGTGPLPLGHKGNQRPPGQTTEERASYLYRRFSTVYREDHLDWHQRDEADKGYWRGCAESELFAEQEAP